jgi:hypothetical protein
LSVAASTKRQSSAAERTSIKTLMKLPPDGFQQTEQELKGFAADVITNELRLCRSSIEDV